MTFVDLFFIGIGLSMDACAVSITNGMCKKNVKIKLGIVIALTFAIFQGIMPLIGYFLGSTFTEYVTAFDHYIALILLSYIGGKMIFDSRKKDDVENKNNLTAKDLILQGIATSIDALAVGVSLSALKIDIFISASTIAAITLVLCFIAVQVGRFTGVLLKSKAQLLGGIILISIGVKIFIEHMFFS